MAHHSAAMQDWDESKQVREDDAVVLAICQPLTAPWLSVECRRHAMPDTTPGVSRASGMVSTLYNTNSSFATVARASRRPSSASNDFVTRRCYFGVTSAPLLARGRVLCFIIACAALSACRRACLSIM